MSGFFVYRERRLLPCPSVIQPLVSKAARFIIFDVVANIALENLIAMYEAVRI
jgi:hypothetical protein